MATNLVINVELWVIFFHIIVFKNNVRTQYWKIRKDDSSGITVKTPGGTILVFSGQIYQDFLKLNC